MAHLKHSQSFAGNGTYTLDQRRRWFGQGEETTDLTTIPDVAISLKMVYIYIFMCVYIIIYIYIYSL